MRNLTGKQVKQIHDALLDGYNPESLRRLVRLHLDENLHNIAGGATFTDVVFTLIEWAEQQGRVVELVRTAHEQNPNNAALQTLWRDLQSWLGLFPAAAPSAPPPLPPALVASLRTVLATLYSDETSTRRVAFDAGIDDTRIAFTGRAVDNWHAILREAEKVGRLAVLLTVALDDYGDHPPLQAAVAALGLGALLPSAKTTQPQAGNPGPGEGAASRLVQPAIQPPPPAKPALPIDLDWVTIPAGKFWMGSDKAKDKMAYDDELPQHELDLPAYRIARTPVTVAQFAEFIKATSYKTTAEQQGSAWGYNTENKWAEIKGANWAHPRGPDSDVTQKANHPVTCVSWYDAVEFCKWTTSVYAAAGQTLTIRLPTEAEWEKAARGTDGGIWPWGNNAPTDKLCNFNGKVGDTTAVGRYLEGKSVYGCLDMAGNVWEWTGSLWGKDWQKPDYGYPYRSGDGREQLEAPDSVLQALRGGSWLSTAPHVRCADRSRFFSAYRRNDGGFRVVSPGS